MEKQILHDALIAVAVSISDSTVDEIHVTPELLSFLKRWITVHPEPEVSKVLLGLLPDAREIYPAWKKLEINP